ncbi:hypothetical protein PVT67_05335 [Gallaecimonas kandeliae]|uniref:hypothetical protein n=1 Tax=Gallaecimonas kandeliae TaxID=3029055 RepID=UPI002649604C|nr:hypothetical protein [Gallaecimonas kandeliae]WKE66669.1 hypothetical protein PVT67_05335 [Gallaecimonas kandeliae]
MKNWLIIFLSLLLSACAARTFDVNPAQLAENGSQYGEEATVYLIRDDTFALSMWSIGAQVDGVDKGTLRRGQYLRMPVVAGKHQLVAAYPAVSGIRSVGIRGDFAAKHTYYFLYSTGAGGDAPVGGISIQYGFTQLSKAQAKKLLDSYEDMTAGN